MTHGTATGYAYHGTKMPTIRRNSPSDTQRDSTTCSLERRISCKTKLCPPRRWHGRGTWHTGGKSWMQRHRTSGAGRAARRRLVDQQTPAELALAKALREAREPFDAQFRVQTLESDGGFYVVDFYLPRRRLLVELDGAPHFTERGKWRDRLRSEAIRRARPNLTLVRFTNSDVLNDPPALARFLRSF